MNRQDLKCFGVAPGGGNAALVLQHDHSSTDQRQQFAREHQQPACVFIDLVSGATVLDFYMGQPCLIRTQLADESILIGGATEFSQPQ